MGQILRSSAEAVEERNPAQPRRLHAIYAESGSGGGCSGPPRSLSLLIYAIDRSATRFLYVHSDPPKRNKAHTRHVSFKSVVDLADYADPT